MFHSDLGVVNLAIRAADAAHDRGAAARLAAITPAGMRALIALTMTDEYPYAYAQVIISGAALGETPFA